MSAIFCTSEAQIVAAEREADKLDAPAGNDVGVAAATSLQLDIPGTSSTKARAAAAALPDPEAARQLLRNVSPAVAMHIVERGLYREQGAAPLTDAQAAAIKAQIREHALC